MLDACVRAFADVLSMSVTLCSGILLTYLEVFKLPLCSPIMERIILDLTAVWEDVQGGETVSEAARKTDFVRMSSILCAWFARRG